MNSEVGELMNTTEFDKFFLLLVLHEVRLV